MAPNTTYEETYRNGNSTEHYNGAYAERGRSSKIVLPLCPEWSLFNLFTLQSSNTTIKILIITHRILLCLCIHLIGDLVYGLPIYIALGTIWFLHGRLILGPGSMLERQPQLRSAIIVTLDLLAALVCVVIGGLDWLAMVMDCMATSLCHRFYYERDVLSRAREGGMWYCGVAGVVYFLLFLRGLVMICWGRGSWRTGGGFEYQAVRLTDTVGVEDRDLG